MSDTIAALKEAVRGRVITASDPDSDDARAVEDAMHDRGPHAVVQCTDSAERVARVGGGDLGGCRPRDLFHVNQNIAPANGR